MEEKMKIEINNIPKEDYKYHILVGMIANAIEASGLDAKFKKIKQGEDAKGMIFNIIDTK